MKANVILIIVVSQKLKKIEEVPRRREIWNDILGDLQMEFAGGSDNGKDLPSLRPALICSRCDLRRKFGQIHVGIGV